MQPQAKAPARCRPVATWSLTRQTKHELPRRLQGMAHKLRQQPKQCNGHIGLRLLLRQGGKQLQGCQLDVRIPIVKASLCQNTGGATELLKRVGAHMRAASMQGGGGGACQRCRWW